MIFTVTVFVANLILFKESFIFTIINQDSYNNNSGVTRPRRVLIIDYLLQ